MPSARQSESKPRKQILAGDSCATPALIPAKKLLRGEESLNLQPCSVARLGPFIPQPTCSAPEGDVFAAQLRGRRGEALRAVVPLLPMAGPRQRPREREAGAFWSERSPKPLFPVRGFP